MYLFSLIIPCYNEAQNLPHLFSKFSNSFENNKIEVIFVDNGSKDRTQYILKKFQKNNNFVKIVIIKSNKGYGNGILKGLEQSSGKYIGWTHADLQTDPEDFIKAVEIINKNKDKKLLIKGHRYGRNFFDVIFTFSMTFFELMLLRTWLPDINGQPTVFSRELFSNWHNPPFDFSLDLFTFYHAKKEKYDIIRYPVFFGPRLFGVGSNDRITAKIKYSIRTIIFSTKMIYKLREKNVKDFTSY